MICDGCGAADAPEELWLAAPLGMCCVRVCRERGCAESARRARGGGRFVARPATPEERLRAPVDPARAEADRLLVQGVRAVAAAMRDDILRGA